MAKSKIAARLKRDQRQATAARSPEAGVAMALALGDEAVAMYAQFHRVSLVDARAAIRRGAGAGRRPSKAAGW